MTKPALQAILVHAAKILDRVDAIGGNNEMRADALVGVVDDFRELLVGAAVHEITSVIDDLSGLPKLGV